MKAAPIQRDPNTRKPYQGSKPLLKISHSKKVTGDYRHTKDVMDFYIESTFFSDQYNTKSGNYRDLYVLYDAYNNRIPESYFNYVTNPLASTRSEHSNYPARIRPYSIIRPNVDLLLGEWDKRPKQYTVTVHNADSVNIMEELLYEAVLNTLQARFVQEVQAIQGEQQQPQKEQESPEEIKDKFLSGYKDQRAIWGQETLSSMDDELHVEEEMARMFKDYVIAGETYSQKGIDRGDMLYERVSPMDIDYDKSPDLEYIEDASWVVRRKFMTPSDVVNQFYDELKSKDVDTLETHDATLPFHSTYFNNMFGNTYRNEEDLRRAKIIVYHVVWRYYKKIGFIQVYNQLTGEIEEAEVDENYKKTGKELSLEWVWITEFWEGYRIDTPNITSNPASSVDAEIIYLGMRPIPYQRTKYNGFSENKNPYNGIRFSDVHSRNISIVELGMPYQIMYMILHYRLELTIAKSKGKIMLLDKNVIPNTKGWDEEKFFYWAEANGFALIDRSQRGVDKSMNQYAAIDMGLYDHIDNLIKIMEYVRQEWDNVIGFTPQRKGQTSASETASGIDAARYQSSIISERVFTSFDEFMRRERQGLLDISKFAYLEGRKAVGYSSDMRKTMLEIDPAIYMESEFNVHVSNSGKDLRNLEMMKAQAQQFASQGASPSMVAEILQSDNISKLKEILKQAELREMQAAERREMNAENMEMQRLKIEESFKEMESRFEMILQDHKYDREEGIAHIKGQYALADTNTPGDELDPLALEQTLQNREKIAQDARLKDKEINLKDKISQRQEQTRKYVADKQLQVARENKTQHELKTKQKTSK
jgi:hypothetical protein